MKKHNQRVQSIKENGDKWRTPLALPVLAVFFFFSSPVFAVGQRINDAWNWLVLPLQIRVRDVILGQARRTMQIGARPTMSIWKAHPLPLMLHQAEMERRLQGPATTI